MIKLAMIGLGNQGQEHLAAAKMCQHACFVAGMDASADTVRRTAERYPDLWLTTSVDELLNPANKLDGMVMALPHHIYPEVMGKVIQAGLPILKEKPLARTMEEAREFIRMATRGKVVLQTAIQRRTHPSYRFLKQAIAATTVLQADFALNLGIARVPGAENWRTERTRSGGGALLDCGYHMVDLALFLLGDFDLVSATVFRDGRPCATKEVDDAFMMTARRNTTWFTLQARVYNDADTVRPDGYPKREECRVQAENGYWRADRAGVIWHPNQGPAEVLMTCAKEWESAMAKQLDDFALNLSRGEQAQTDVLWEQQPAQQLIQQGYQLAFNWHGGAR